MTKLHLGNRKVFAEELTQYKFPTTYEPHKIFSFLLKINETIIQNRTRYDSCEPGSRQKTTRVSQTFLHTSPLRGRHRRYTTNSTKRTKRAGGHFRSDLGEAFGVCLDVAPCERERFDLAFVTRATHAGHCSDDFDYGRKVRLDDLLVHWIRCSERYQKKGLSIQPGKALSKRVRCPFGKGPWTR